MVSTVYFNVISSLVSDDCYYYFCCDDKIIYQGYELPENANDYLVMGISGGENEHGPYLAFDVY